MKRVLAVFALLLASTAWAEQPRVIVMLLDDTIQPVSADYLARGLALAAAQHASAVLIELDTPGGLLDSMRRSWARCSPPRSRLSFMSRPPAAEPDRRDFFYWRRPMLRRWLPAATPARPIRW